VRRARAVTWGEASACVCASQTLSERDQARELARAAIGVGGGYTHCLDGRRKCPNEQ
jgi:hypothetical protein